MLADKHAFPLSPHERTDLAKVAQVICVEQKRSYACEAVQNEFLAQIRPEARSSGAGRKPGIAAGSARRRGESMQIELRSIPTAC